MLASRLLNVCMCCTLVLQVPSAARFKGVTHIFTFQTGMVPGVMSQVALLAGMNPEVVGVVVVTRAYQAYHTMLGKFGFELVSQGKVDMAGASSQSFMILSSVLCVTGTMWRNPA